MTDTAPSQPTGATVLGDTELQSSVLEDMGSAPNYQAWLVSLARPHLGDNPIELGSGLGDYAQDWLDAGVPRITVTEADPQRLGHLRDRFAGDDRVRVAAIDLDAPPADGDHSAFVSFNVLEHLPDDVQALRVARDLVRPGGKVISFVPAFEFAMSPFDRAIGHVRRYRTGLMHDKLLAAGLVPDTVRYVNAPGLLAWFVGMRLLRMQPGEGPILKVWDGQVVPRARRLEARRRPPFGQSVFSVATVPQD
jgi:SAM-dependent methyltransferase